jgi:hypothetical protein
LQVSRPEAAEAEVNKALMDGMAVVAVAVETVFLLAD